MDPKILKKVQNNPALFFEQVLGVDSMEAYHYTICSAISTYDRVAISACHSLGKTWIMARAVLWFLYCHRSSMVITTAPTNRQVEMLLWGEIGAAIKKAPFNLGGHLTQKKIWIDYEWYALGFSPQKSAGGDDSGEQQGSTFQGFHGDYVLIVFDEAVGVPPDIWTQVEGLLTSGKIVKFICIANPTTKNCNFFELFSMPSWKKIELSCFDSPNLIANGITDLEKLEAEVEKVRVMDEGPLLEHIKSYKKPVPHLLSLQWVVEKALEWGVDDARFQSKVLGQFPDFDDSVMIQSKDIEASQARKQMAKEKGARFIGIDVARFGDDKSVFTEIIEGEDGAPPVHTRTKKTAKKDLMETTGDSIRFIMDDWEGEKVIVCVDATGLGSGVLDRLVELQKEGEIPKQIRFIELHYGASVKGIQKGKKPTKKEALEQKTFLNIKALMFDDLARAIKNEIRLRKDSTYNSQLPTIKYKFNSAGKMVIESKADYKKRTGKPSPDESDSLAMANFARRFTSIGEYLKRMIKG